MKIDPIKKLNEKLFSNKYGENEDKNNSPKQPAFVFGKQNSLFENPLNKKSAVDLFLDSFSGEFKKKS